MTSSSATRAGGIDGLDGQRRADVRDDEAAGPGAPPRRRLPARECRRACPRRDRSRRGDRRRAGGVRGRRWRRAAGMRSSGDRRVARLHGAARSVAVSRLKSRPSTSKSALMRPPSDSSVRGSSGHARASRTRSRSSTCPFARYAIAPVALSACPTVPAAMRVPSSVDGSNVASALHVSGCSRDVVLGRRARSRAAASGTSAGSAARFTAAEPSGRLEVALSEPPSQRGGLRRQRRTPRRAPSPARRRLDTSRASSCAALRSRRSRVRGRRT